MKIGEPLRRKEDFRLLTGNGRFSDDFQLDGQVHAAMVRSPHAHALIRKVSTEKAKAAPGVLGVFTGADCAAEGLGPIDHTPMPSTNFDMKLTAPAGRTLFYGPHVLLPGDKARHVGEAVAMVIAHTQAQALDAVEAVEVDYEPLPAVTHSEDALARGAPLVWDEAPDNLVIDTTFGDAQATARAFAAAAHVVKMHFHVPRVTACALEPRAALGAYRDGRYTLWAPSGGAVRQKRDLAGVLGVDKREVRVITADVGGNFGSRNRAYVEYGLVLWAARRLARPVKFTASRAESLISDYQGRDLVTSLELALDAQGHFLALRASNVSNVGARCVSLSPLSKGSGLITGPYRIPAATLRSRAVFTNTAPTNPYRSSGRPEITFALERLVDTAARELGIDRVELRRRNLVPPQAMPYRNAVGMTYDSGTYEANLDLAMRLADWSGFPARRDAALKRGGRLGIGLASYVESSIGSPKERAEVAVLPEGRVRVIIGTQSSGQGHETSFAQVLSQLISVPVESVEIIVGDTDVVAAGGGSHSGRSMRHAATVFSIAAKELIEKGARIASFLLEAPAVFRDGRFRAGDRSFDFLELAAAADRALLPGELQGALAVVADHEMHDPVFPNGCAICECEVDPQTGAVSLTRYTAVDDVGRCINPLIVHGQTHGGIAQGVGQALGELCAADALAEFGVRNIALPATAHAIWRMIHGR